MPNPHTRRGLMSLNPIVFLLFLLLIAVCVWRGWLVLDALSATTGSGAYAAASRVGTYIGLVIGPLLVCAVAGGVGAGLYFATGRSDGAANAGIAIVLMLGIGLYGYGTYVFATRPTSASTAAKNTPNTARAMNQQAHEQLDAMRQEQQRQLDQMKERMRNPASPPPPQTSVPSGEPRASTPAGTTPGPQAPAPPSALTAEQAENERKAKAALNPLREEVRAKATAFLSAADPVVAALAKPPRALKSELDKRVAETTDLNQKAVDLEAYFRGLDERIDGALQGAGIDLGTQIRQKVEFGRSVDAFGRANAAAGYKRLFEAGLEEAETLRNNAGKWRNDAAGLATSTDSFLNSTLRRLREGVQTHIRGVSDMRNTLNKP